jgi:hypothetical protein
MSFSGLVEVSQALIGSREGVAANASALLLVFD